MSCFLPLSRPSLFAFHGKSEDSHEQMNFRFPTQTGRVTQTVLSFTEAIPIRNVSHVSGADEKKKLSRDVRRDIYKLINLTDLFFFFPPITHAITGAFFFFSFMSNISHEPEL